MTHDEPTTNEAAAPPRWPARFGGGEKLSDVGETGLLSRILPRLPRAAADVGPGDDAAVLPATNGRVVVTTDSMLDTLDWRDDWSSPFDVGVKVITQNIADVVAMGATPCGVVVALASDPATNVDWVLALTDGMADELRRARTGSLGGDLSGAGQGATAITVTALGVLPPGRAPLTRDAARPGDLVVVSDRLGRSHAGLLELLGAVPKPQEASAAEAAQECVAFHRAPRPRYAGDEAVSAGMRCALDVSDGLGLDAARIATASGVRIDLDGRAIQAMAEPLVPVVGNRARECVLAGGEEHAMLGTCRPGRVPAGWTVIGEVAAGTGLSLDGEALRPRGWSHYVG